MPAGRAPPGITRGLGGETSKEGPPQPGERSYSKGWRARSQDCFSTKEQLASFSHQVEPQKLKVRTQSTSGRDAPRSSFPQRVQAGQGRNRCGGWALGWVDLRTLGQAQGPYPPCDLPWLWLCRAAECQPLSISSPPGPDHHAVTGHDKETHPIAPSLLPVMTPYPNPGSTAYKGTWGLSIRNTSFQVESSSPLSCHHVS